MRAPSLVLITMIATGAGSWMGMKVRHSQRRADPMAMQKSGEQAYASQLGVGIVPMHLSNSSDDAFGTLLSIIQDKGDLKIRAQLADALKDLNAEQCEAFVKKVSTMSRQYHGLCWAILEHWIEIDPKGAWSRIEKLVSAADYRLLVASKDPDAAIALATSLDRRDPSGAVLLRSAIAKKAGNSPLAQAQLLESLPSSKLRDALIRDILLTAAREDAWKMLPLFEQLPPGKLRDGMLHDITWYAADSDPQAALEFVRRQPESEEKQSALRTALLKLIKVNPDGAIKEANQLLPNLSPGMFGSSFANDFAESLASKDLTTARAWVEALPSDVAQYPLIAVAREWAKSDPGTALDWAVAHGVNVAEHFPEGRGRWSDDVMTSALRSHPEETVQWLRQQPAGSERDRLIERAFNERLGNRKTSPENSNEILFSLFTDLSPEAQLRSARSWTAKRAEQEDFDLQKWANQFPSKAAQSEAIAAGIQVFAGHNPDRAQAELDQINDPGLGEIARRGVIVATGAKQPDIAAKQAMELRDPEVRYDVLSRFIPTWLGRSPGAAQAWMNQAGIPQEWRAAWQLDADLNFQTGSQ